MKSRIAHVFLDRSSLGLLAVAFIAGLSTSSYADSPELITDRPDQTESAVVVPPGSVQVEVGYTHFRDDDGGVRTEIDEAPGTLVRIGLTDRVELRLGWAGEIRETVSVGGTSFDLDGAGDAEVGAKIVLRDSEGPDVALLVATSVPIGDDAFTSDDYDPSFRFSVAHDPSERLSLGYNVGMAWATELDERGVEDTVTTAIYTLALGIGLSERWGAFVELYGDLPTDGGKPAHAFDGGLTYLVRPNVQLDLAGGVGLSDAADDWFVGLGVSFRVPR